MQEETGNMEPVSLLGNINEMMSGDVPEDIQSASKKLLDDEMKYEDQRRVAALLDEENESWYANTISSKMNIGSFQKDNVSQTDNEIATIKELIETARKLDESNNEIKNIQTIKNNSIKGYYEKKIAVNTHKVYSRINEAIAQMEQIYKEELDHIRRAKRQELDNAIKELKDQYETYYEAELKKRLKNVQRASIDYASLNAPTSSGDEIYEQLALALQENEELREQLEQQNIPQVIVDTSAAEKANAASKKLEGEMGRVTKELDHVKLDLSIANRELTKMENQKHQMESMVKAEQEQNKKLQGLTRDLQNKLNLQAQDHKNEITRIISAHEEEKGEITSKHESKYNRQRTDYEEQLSETKEKALAQITMLEMDLGQLRKRNKSMNGRLGDLHKNLESKKVQNERDKPEIVKENDPLDKYPESNSAAQNMQIAELQNELRAARIEASKLNRNWETRFKVLRASMHEIKDEAFIRKRIEFQPMALHTRKVKYRNEGSRPITSSDSVCRRQKTKKSNHSEDKEQVVKRAQDFSPSVSDAFYTTDDGDNSNTDSEMENNYITN